MRACVCAPQSGQVIVLSRIGFKVTGSRLSPGLLFTEGAKSPLERDIVVLEITHAAGSRLLGGRRASAAHSTAARLWLRAFAIAAALAGAARTAFATAAEHLH